MSDRAQGRRRGRRRRGRSVLVPPAAVAASPSTPPRPCTAGAAPAAVAWSPGRRPAGSEAAWEAVNPDPLGAGTPGFRGPGPEGGRGAGGRPDGGAAPRPADRVARRPRRPGRPVPQAPGQERRALRPPRGAGRRLRVATQRRGRSCGIRDRLRSDPPRWSRTGVRSSPAEPRRTRSPVVPERGRDAAPADAGLRRKVGEGRRGERAGASGGDGSGAEDVSPAEGSPGCAAEDARARWSLASSAPSASASLPGHAPEVARPRPPPSPRLSDVGATAGARVRGLRLVCPSLVGSFPATNVPGVPCARRGPGECRTFRRGGGARERAPGAPEGAGARPWEAPGPGSLRGRERERPRPSPVRGGGTWQEAGEGTEGSGRSERGGEDRGGGTRWDRLPGGLLPEAAGWGPPGRPHRSE